MQPYVRGGILKYFSTTVEMFGGDPAELFEQANVAPEVMTIPGIFVPYASYMRLMDIAARSLGVPHIGLLMARSGNAETLGAVGIIMTQAETVGAAWDTLIHFYRIHDTYGRVRMYRYPDTMLVSYALPRNDQPGTRQVYDVAAGMTANIMRQFCGADFIAEELNFPYPEPTDISPYSELPARRVNFGASTMEMHISARVMSQQLPGRSDELHSILGGNFAKQSEGSGSAVRVVEDMIRRLLPTGECTLPRVAEMLATTPRTLQARLDAEDSSFRQLLENVRREIATFHLRRGDMQLTQLAMVLGYSELSAFSRSFRSWYGVSPRRWVRQGNLQVLK